jgi:hypothetical protein
MRYLKWAAPAALVSAVLALSACGGGGMNATPGTGMGQSLGTQRVAGEKHITSQMIQVNKTPKCPTKDNLGCFTDSLANGLVISWCYGPTSVKIPTRFRGAVASK